MQFDFAKVPAPARYELLLSTILPRPITIITTLNPDDSVNAAPYSLFNVMGHDPAIVAVSILPHAEARLKDTGSNILATSQFVLNMVSEALAEAMNITCIEAPAGVSELELAQLGTKPSSKVRPPRIAASPVTFECELVTALSFGPNQAMVLGRVLEAHVGDEFVKNSTTGEIDTPRLRLIGGMHGARWYSRTSDQFAMDRPTWAAWKAQGKV